MGTERDSSKAPRRRGRPPGKQNVTGTRVRRRPRKQHGVQEPAFAVVKQAESEAAPQVAEQLVVANKQPEQVPDEENLSPFSSLLRDILRQDRSEIARVASELEVAENTVYRWLNGNSEPRTVHLKRLLEVLPGHRRNLAYAINQTFPGVLDSLSIDLREVQKDIYRRVLELRVTTVDDDARRWQITQTIFEHALLHLDSDRRGLSITYARLMPPRKYGIHSLYELEMRGTYPWPFTLESKAYLGSTTLAGMAAMLQRMQTWDDLDTTGRLQVMVDDFERSACAHPVMQSGRMAGVLVISSTQPGFFMNPTVCQAVIEYARLLSLAFNEHDFYPCSELRLVPMPDLKWQRAEISRSYVNRVIVCARKRNLSLAEAEEYIRREMEEEFERRERAHLEKLPQGEESYPTTLLDIKEP